jgi:hypothetical protein
MRKGNATSMPRSPTVANAYSCARRGSICRKNEMRAAAATPPLREIGRDD